MGRVGVISFATSSLLRRHLFCDEMRCPFCGAPIDRAATTSTVRIGGIGLGAATEALDGPAAGTVPISIAGRGELARDGAAPCHPIGKKFWFALALFIMSMASCGGDAARVAGHPIAGSDASTASALASLDSAASFEGAATSDGDSLSDTVEASEADCGVCGCSCRVEAGTSDSSDIDAAAQDCDFAGGICVDAGGGCNGAGEPTGFPCTRPEQMCCMRYGR